MTPKLVTWLGLTWLCSQTAWAQAPRLDAPNELADSAEQVTDPAVDSREPLQMPLGEVISIDGETATISLGAEDGLTLDAHIAFLEAERSDDWHSAEPTVVGRVINLAEDRALVRLGILEDVSVGATVQVTLAKLTASRFAPPKTPAHLLFGAGFRPFLPLQRVSIGAAVDLSLTYLPDLPLFLTAEITPLAGRIGKGPDAGAAAGGVTFGYEHRLFSIGLGIGVASYRRYLIDDDDDWVTDGHLGRAVPRFAFGQQLRLGARDGVHVHVSSSFALTDEVWRLAWLRATGQVRLGSGAWISPRLMAAPQMGFFSMEAGLRILARGNGGVGSLFVRPCAGVAGTYDARKNHELEEPGPGLEAMLWGPMIGVDLEWRL